VVMSFSSRAIRRIRRDAPALPTVLLLGAMTPARRIGALPAFADYAGPSVEVLRADPGYVARSAARGHPTYCWTVDDPEDVRLCQRLGVHFVATNRPAGTRAVLDAGPNGSVAPAPP
jgi:glycerophosphoryl diester phosphodiesterase